MLQPVYNFLIIIFCLNLNVRKKIIDKIIRKQLFHALIAFQNKFDVDGLCNVLWINFLLSLSQFRPYNFYSQHLIKGNFKYKIS